MNRTELKSKICKYFTENGVNREMLPKILKAIKEVDQPIEIDSCFLKEVDRKTVNYIKDLGLASRAEFYYRISWNFAPKHYFTVVGFVEDYFEILAAEDAADRLIEDSIQEEIGQSYGWDENLYDELGAPEAAIVVYSDKIEVRAYETGLGTRLPKKDRKYVGSQGDMRWHYPLSALDSLKKFSFPIVTAQ